MLYNQRYTKSDDGKRYVASKAHDVPGTSQYKSVYADRRHGLTGLVAQQEREGERAAWTQHYQRSAGSKPGITRFGVMDEAGNPEAGATFIWQDREFVSADGKFTMADTEFFGKVLAAEADKRAHTEKLMETALISDNTFELIYGTDELAKLKAGKGFPIGGSDGAKHDIDAVLVAIDASPDMIKTYARKSPELARALQKMYLYLYNYANVLWSAGLPSAGSLTTNTHKGPAPSAIENAVKGKG